MPHLKTSPAWCDANRGETAFRCQIEDRFYGLKPLKFRLIPRGVEYMFMRCVFHLCALHRVASHASIAVLRVGPQR